jgi:hypothetical protein
MATSEVASTRGTTMRVREATPTQVIVSSETLCAVRINGHTVYPADITLVYEVEQRRDMPGATFEGYRVIEEDAEYGSIRQLTFEPGTLVARLDESWQEAIRALRRQVLNACQMERLPAKRTLQILGALQALEDEMLEAGE